MILKEKMDRIGNLNAIDLGKFIMAIVVIAIHTHPFEGCSNHVFMVLYNLICSIAVPFFFISTGYLLAIKLKSKKNNHEKKEVINKTLYKTIKFYIIWSLVYLPLAIYDYFFFADDALLGSYVLYDLLLYIRGLIFVGEHFNSWILWYLLSAIYALLMIKKLILKGKSIKDVFIVGTIVFIIGIFLNNVAGRSGDVSEVELIIQTALKYTFTNGRLTTAFLYIPLGMMIYELALEVSNRKGAMMVILGAFLSFVPMGNALIVGYFIPPLTVLGCFLVALNTKLDNKKIYLQFRMSSIVMFFTHLWVYSIYGLIVNGTLIPARYGMKEFLVTLMVTLMMSVVYVKYLEKYKYI